MGKLYANQTEIQVYKEVKSNCNTSNVNKYTSSIMMNFLGFYITIKINIITEAGTWT